MASYSDDVLDAGLNRIKNNADEVHILSQEPTSYAEVSTYTLGNRSLTSADFTGPQDNGGSGGGRELLLDSFSDGSVTSSGTATHWAIVDTGSSELLATNDLSSSQSVTSGNDFSLPSTAMETHDPTSI